MEYFRQRFIDELNDEGPVRIRDFEWQNVDVLSTMEPESYGLHFDEWVTGQKQEAKERAKAFLKEFGCIDRFERLIEQCTSKRVLPFIGAGMSASSGFPTWAEFLRSLTTDFVGCVEELEALLDNWQYEEAAQLMLDRMGNHNFNEAVENTFGRRNKSIDGPVQLLPFLFNKGVISTNFDYILDRVYRDSGNAFENFLVGGALRDAPKRLATTPHCLIRLHGEADSANGRVLTSKEYEACYENEGVYKELICHTVGSASLLFLGCSLTVDRTIKALMEVKADAKVDTPRHYAFLPLREDLEREQRRSELAQADIHPIWYPPEDHDQAIEALLISLIEGGLDD